MIDKNKFIMIDKNKFIMINKDNIKQIYINIDF